MRYWLRDAFQSKQTRRTASVSWIGRVVLQAAEADTTTASAVVRQAAGARQM